MKKVISFSLSVDKNIYNIGAIKNPDLAVTIYPDFECWFYVHNKVQQNIIDQLVSKPKLKIIFKDDTQLNKSRIWRFESLVDNNVEIPIVDYKYEKKKQLMNGYIWINYFMF